MTGIRRLTIMPTVSKYNPHAIHRKVRVDQILEDGVVTWKTYSMTRPGHDVVHHPAIDFRTGEVTCTCADHQYRRAKLHPTVHSGQDKMCKHAWAALTNLRRKAQ
jgi:hypothetical protein